MPLKAAPSRLKAAPSRLRMPPKIAESFYQSKEWRAAAERARRRAGHKCEVCAAHRSETKLIVDHIVERKDGGADFDQSNLQVLCMPCHNAKTAKARKRRARG